MNRSRVGATAAAGALAVTSFLVASAAADDPPTEVPETVELKVLNGKGNKAFLYGDEKQEFASSHPWTLIDPPAIISQPAGDPGVPRHFGGRQRIGVASDGEKGGATDSISPGEVLTLTRGGLLEDDGRFFNGLIVHLQGSGTAVIDAKLDGVVKATAVLAVAPFIYTDGKPDQNEEKGVVTLEGDDPGPLFTDVVFDTVEFRAEEGAYGIKGFRNTVFSLTPPSTVVGTLEDGVTIEGSNGVQSASVQCIADGSEQNCEGQELDTQVSVTVVGEERRVDVTFPGKDPDVETPLLQVEINWGPEDSSNTFPNTTPTTFDPNTDDETPGEPVQDCAFAGEPEEPGDSCLLAQGFQFGGDYTETYAFISDPRWFR